MADEAGASESRAGHATADETTPPRSSPPGRGVGPFSARHLLAVAAAAVAAARVLGLVTAPLGTPGASGLPEPGSTFVLVGDPVPGLAVGQAAPELEGTVDGQRVGLADLSGRPVRLADLRGKVVWLDFWASWCPPCQQETPVLQRTHERYAGEDFALVAVSVQETSPDDVRRYVETYGLEYTVGFDASAAVFHTYQVYGLPTQVFLDRDGVIRSVVKGPLTDEQAAAIIEPLLEEA